MARKVRVLMSWAQVHRSIVALAVSASIVGIAAPARAGRLIEEAEPFSIEAEGESIDLENFGLLPRWTEPVYILNRSDERLRSLAVFHLAQVAPPKSADEAEPEAVVKPAFRTQLPQVRGTAESPAGEAPPEAPPPPAPKDAVPPQTFSAAKMDLRDRDLAERPTLLQPGIGPWLGDVPLVPIQNAMQPQVIPPPITETDVPLPKPEPAEVAKPELFPNADSPTSPLTLPWETSRGGRVSPVEPEPETPPPATAELNPEPNTELKLRNTDAPWDLAQLQGPLFGTENISEFTGRINAKGAWAVNPHLSLTSLYDGNVFLSEKGQESDFVVNVSPGVTARLGNDQTALYLLADYTFGAVFFTENAEENSFNHNGRLELDYKGSRLSLGLNVGVENDTGTSIDATDRVNRTAYRVGAESRFQYSDKFSFDLNADYRRSYYEDLIGSQDYSVQGYANYHYSPKLSIGLGVGASATEVEEGRSQDSQTFTLRANWVATGKLTVEGSLGVGFYQFSDGESDSLNPVASLSATYVATGKLTFSGNFGLGVNRFASSGSSLSPTYGLDAKWAVWQGTDITFGVHRRIFSSVVFTDQNYTSTGLTFGLRQQLGIRFVAFVTAGYENLSYTSAGEGVEATREDDFIFARFGLQWHAFNRCSFGVFYEFSQNSSGGQNARDFRRDRMGAQMSIAF